MAERTYSTDEIVCIGCGCSDSHACPGGCRWAAMDEAVGLGICCTCAAKPLSELVGTALALGAEFPADADRVTLASPFDIAREVA